MYCLSLLTGNIHTQDFSSFFFSFFRLAEHQPTPPLSTTDEQGQNSSVYVDHTDTAVRSQLRRLHSEMFSVPIYQKLSGLSLSFAYRRPPPPSHHHNVFRPNSFFNFHSDDEWMPWTIFIAEQISFFFFLGCIIEKSNKQKQKREIEREFGVTCRSVGDERFLHLREVVVDSRWSDTFLAAALLKKEEKKRIIKENLLVSAHWYWIRFILDREKKKKIAVDWLSKCQDFVLSLFPTCGDKGNVVYTTASGRARKIKDADNQENNNNKEKKNTHKKWRKTVDQLHRHTSNNVISNHVRQTIAIGWRSLLSRKSHQETNKTKNTSGEGEKKKSGAKKKDDYRDGARVARWWWLRIYPSFIIRWWNDGGWRKPVITGASTNAAGIRTEYRKMNKRKQKNNNNSSRQGTFFSSSSSFYLKKKNELTRVRRPRQQFERRRRKVKHSRELYMFFFVLFARAAISLCSPASLIDAIAHEENIFFFVGVFFFSVFPFFYYFSL